MDPSPTSSPQSFDCIMHKIAVQHSLIDSYPDIGSSSSEAGMIATGIPAPPLPDVTETSGSSESDDFLSPYHDPLGVESQFEQQQQSSDWPVSFASDRTAAAVTVPFGRTNDEQDSLDFQEILKKLPPEAAIQLFGAALGATTPIGRARGTDFSGSLLDHREAITPLQRRPQQPTASPPSLSLPAVSRSPVPVPHPYSSSSLPVSQPRADFRVSSPSEAITPALAIGDSLLRRSTTGRYPSNQSPQQQPPKQQVHRILLETSSRSRQAASELQGEALLKILRQNVQRQQQQKQESHMQTFVQQAAAPPLAFPAPPTEHENFLSTFKGRSILNNTRSTASRSSKKKALMGPSISSGRRCDEPPVPTVIMTTQPVAVPYAPPSMAISKRNIPDAAASPSVPRSLSTSGSMVMSSMMPLENGPLPSGRSKKVRFASHSRGSMKPRVEWISGPSGLPMQDMWWTRRELVRIRQECRAIVKRYLSCVPNDYIDTLTAVLERPEKQVGKPNNATTTSGGNPADANKSILHVVLHNPDTRGLEQHIITLTRAKAHRHVANVSEQSQRLRQSNTLLDQDQMAELLRLMSITSTRTAQSLARKLAICDRFAVIQQEQAEVQAKSPKPVRSILKTKSRSSSNIDELMQKDVLNARATETWLKPAATQFKFSRQVGRDPFPSLRDVEESKPRSNTTTNVIYQDSKLPQKTSTVVAPPILQKQVGTANSVLAVSVTSSISSATYKKRRFLRGWFGSKRDGSSSRDDDDIDVYDDDDEYHDDDDAAADRNGLDDGLDSLSGSKLTLRSRSVTPTTTRRSSKSNKSSFWKWAHCEPPLL